MSLKERIRAANDRKGEPLEIPEWGETVYVRRLSAREAIDLRDWSEALEQSQPDEMRRGVEMVLRVVTLATVDADGNQLFGDADAEWLADKSQEVLRRIFDRAGAQSGLSAEARAEIRKNSAGAGGSPTASPSPSDAPTSTDSSTP